MYAPFLAILISSDESSITYQVPKNAELKIKVYDKDDKLFTDDYIGAFKLNIEQTGLRECEIEGRMGKKHGIFYMDVGICPCFTCTP